MRERGVYQKIGRISVLKLIQANLEANGYNFDDYDGYIADKTAFVCHISLKKKPEQLNYIKVLQKYFPEEKKILLVRDIRDIIVSVASWPGRAEKLHLLDLHPKGYIRFIRYINNWIKLHECWLDNMMNDKNSLVLSFESMKLNFTKVMENVLNFLDFSPDSDYLENLKNNFYSIKSKTYLDENRIRGYNFYRSGEVGEWRKRLKWYHLLILCIYKQKIIDILNRN